MRSRMAILTWAIVLAVVALILLAGASYLVIRWADPNACPGIQATDPTCIRIRD
jgi:hypothetical protein